MKIAVWHTNHGISQTVSQAVVDGLQKSKNQIYSCGAINAREVSIAEAHIGYGVLRGMTEVYRECIKQDKAIFLLDNGYWGAGHFSGQYRISFKGTQSKYSDTLGAKRNGLDFHGVSLEYPEEIKGDTILIVPPSDYVCEFFGVDKKSWIYFDAIKKFLLFSDDKHIILIFI